MNFYNFLAHLGFGLIAISYLLEDILWLRIVAIVANSTIAAYNYLVPKEPLWIVIFWSVVFIGINITQIILLMRERRGIKFSEEEKELYHTVFACFSPVEFMKLLRIAEWKKARAGEVLMNAVEKSGKLLLIYNGEAIIEKEGNAIAKAKDGTFIGEIEYTLDRPNCATVKVVTPTKYLEWNTNNLKALLRRNPSMSASMQKALSQDLIQKLQQRKSDLVVEDVNARFYS
ncbi:MAG: cyclic nucleotide-binding domain-containing protein [Candidatus Brocadiae bacterium]|nr:cyclic nucleotide-binding domain-containing protein [Candidatus Brocadiia bacterium]